MVAAFGQAAVSTDGPWWREEAPPNRRRRAMGRARMNETRTWRGHTFGRMYAAGYDWVTDRLDRRGAEDHRRRLVDDASGVVLEIGAGTGRNLPLYRSARRVVALEPDVSMATRARRAAATAHLPVHVVQGDGMRLPFADASFETVVTSLVLCSVPDPRSVLSEVRRVMKAVGTLRFYEHVRSADPRLACWQDRLERLWGWIGRGCHPNRDTAGVVADAGLRISRIETFDFASVPRIVRPHVLGIAETRSGSIGSDEGAET
jgi:SAM-dependent methyltransferase